MQKYPCRMSCIIATLYKKGLSLCFKCVPINYKKLTLWGKLWSSLPFDTKKPITQVKLKPKWLVKVLWETLLLARFPCWSVRESLSPELYLLKSLPTGPLNRTGKVGSCPTQNNFIELWSTNFSHINMPDGHDTPITEIPYSIDLRGSEVSQGEYTGIEGSSMLKWGLPGPFPW